MDTGKQISKIIETGNIIINQNETINECMFEILSFMEHSSHNAASANMSANRISQIYAEDDRKNLISEFYAELFEFRKGNPNTEGDDFDLWDTCQMVRATMPDDEQVKKTMESFRVNLQL